MIQLVPFTRDDFADLISWTDSPETLMQYAGPIYSFPLTEEQLMAALADAQRMFYTVVETATARRIGHAEIYKGTEKAFLCCIYIGNKAFRNRGLGYEVVSRLLEIVFIDLGYRRAELNVFDWNEPAIRCYRKAGFKPDPAKEGVRKIGEQSWRVINMYLRKSTWLRTAKKQVP